MHPNRHRHIALPSLTCPVSSGPLSWPRFSSQVPPAPGNKPKEVLPVEPGQTFTARVVEVTDGDIYRGHLSCALVDRREVTIRLHGVDGEPS